MTSPGKHLLKELTCSACGMSFSPEGLHTFSPCCRKPLLAQYVLEYLPQNIIQQNDHSMWRYSALLPLKNTDCKTSLGEGMTPLLSLHNLSKEKKIGEILLKDES